MAATPPSAPPACFFLSRERRALVPGFSIRLVSLSLLLVVIPNTAFSSPSSGEARRLIEDGRYAAAEATARRALGEVAQRSVEAAEVLDVLVEALWRGGKVTRDETLELARQAVEIKEQALGEEDSSTVASRSTLAWVTFRRAERESVAAIDSAMAQARRVLATQERILGPDHPDVATTLDYLGWMVMRRLSNFVDASRHFERSVSILERSLGPDHPRVAECLADLGYAFDMMGKPLEAEKVVTRALAIQRQKLRSGHPLLAQSLDEMAYVHWYRGSEESLSLWEEALAIAEKELGPDHHEVAWYLFGLNTWYSQAGDSRRGIELSMRSASIYERSLGADHYETLWVKLGLVFRYMALAEYGKAERLCDELFPVFRRVIGDEREEMANLHQAHAGVLEAPGKYAEAKRAYEEALALLGKIHGPDLENMQYYVVQPMLGYASLLHEMGEYQATRRVVERAVGIAEKMTGDRAATPRWLAVSLGVLAQADLGLGDTARAFASARRAIELGGTSYFLTLGDVFWAAGQPDSARACFEHVAALVGSPADANEASSGRVWSTVGAKLAQAGAPRAARPYLERSLALFERALGPDHPRISNVLSHLARVEWQLGEPERAVEHAMRAEDIGRAHARLAARALSEVLAARVASSRGSGLAVLLSAATEASRPEIQDQAWDALIRSRAVVLDEMAARHRTASMVEDPNLAQIWDIYASRSERLAALAVRGPGGQDLAQHRRLLEEARQEEERAEEDFARASASFRAERNRGRIGLAAIASALPAGSALIAFALYEHERRGEARMPGAVPSYLAFVLPSGSSHPEVVPLGPASEIDELVRSWRDKVQEPPASNRLPGEAEAACRAAGAQLRERIWDPVVAQLDSAERVFIVPDGALNLVSFAALPVGGSAYLVESGPLVHYLSAERDLVLEPQAAPPGHGLLAVAGAAFDSHPTLADAPPPTAALAALFRGPRSACGGFESLLFEPLPAATMEAKEIARLWRRSADPGVTLLEGPRATETAFKQEAPGKRVLHVASHAFFLGSRCPSALEDHRGIGIMLGPTTPDELPPVAGENPLLLAGLAFAGANLRQDAPLDQDDGILTAQEIATLNLQGAEWAVLSACDTGAGEVRSGEGVFGLRRAFTVAGARTLVMSLWAVEDEAARAWMQKLYEARLVRGLGTAEAMRAASLERLGELRSRQESTHPSAWAAFVATGDWR